MAFTPAYDLDNNNLLGYIGDLTLQGALIIGENPIATNILTTIGIDFPETPEFPARRVTIPARVAWSKKEQGVEYYDSGIEFQNISERNKTILEAILERYHYRNEAT